MKIILDIYLRSNNDKLDEKLDDMFELNGLANYSVAIPNHAIYIGIIFYGKYYSKIFLTHNRIYDYYCGSRLVISQIMYKI